MVQTQKHPPNPPRGEFDLGKFFSGNHLRLLKKSKLVYYSLIIIACLLIWLIQSNLIIFFFIKKNTKEIINFLFDYILGHYN